MYLVTTNVSGYLPTAMPDDSQEYHTLADALEAARDIVDQCDDSELGTLERETELAFFDAATKDGSAADMLARHGETHFRFADSLTVVSITRVPAQHPACYGTGTVGGHGFTRCTGCKGTGYLPVPALAR